ncbi:MAG: hypothetical protein LBH94_01660, partial [Deltaproteobacteria bacterium]|nr:hypothetical protein [Deltaproteobacteria bacterium]
TAAESFSLPGDAPLLEQVRAVLRQAAAGDMGVDVAAEIVGMLSAAARIQEVDLLKGEVASLKQILETRAPDYGVTYYSNGGRYERE